MKKLLMYMILIGGLLCLTGSQFAGDCYTVQCMGKGVGVAEHFNAKEGIPSEYTPEEGSIEELYKDMIVTQLSPVIADAIEKYYGKPLLYGLYDVRFMEVDRAAYRAFSFLVKVQVEPFVGAHNTIGQDELIIRITPGETKVERFTHLKSYPVPDYRP